MFVRDGEEFRGKRQSGKLSREEVSEAQKVGSIKTWLDLTGRKTSDLADVVLRRSFSDSSYIKRNCR